MDDDGDRSVDDDCVDDGGMADEYSAVTVGIQPEVDVVVPCGLTTAVPEVASEEALDKVEVVKPDISSSNTEKRMSPTNSRTTSAAAVLMLYTAGRAWGTILSHGMRPDDTILDEMLDEMLGEKLDEIAEELNAVLLIEVLGALERCDVFDGLDSS